MKKRIVLTGIISLLLVFGVISCKDPTSTTTYTATYAVGRGSGDAPVKQTVDEGTAINLPNQRSMTAPSGETFDGWKDGGGTTYTAGTSYTVTANVLFTAQWKNEEIPLDPPKSNLYTGTGTTVTLVSDAGTTLTENLDWLDEYAATPGVYTIKVSASGSMDEIELKSDRLGDLSSVDITLTTAGTAEMIIALKSNGRLFTVGDGGAGDNITLTLGGSITLQGRSNNITQLVHVNRDDTLKLTENAKITGNNSGGGVEVDGGTITMSGGTISGNNGGGVRLRGLGATFTMFDGEISGNTAGEGSGVKVEDSAEFTMTGGTISGNTSTWGGGGVRVQSNGKFTMSGGEISDNTASKDSGGGVNVVDNATFTMSGGTISGNTAREGGGVRVEHTGTIFEMSGGKISGNTAESGGGVRVQNNATFNMSGTAVISGNTARDGGGVKVQNTGTTFTMSGGTISGNTSTWDGGGGVRVESATFAKSGGTIYGSDGSALKNTATNTNYGQAVQLDPGPGNKKRNLTAGSEIKLYATYVSGSWIFDDGGSIGDTTANWVE
ncbi:hypothetical protein FACS189444_1300 [Spirochaetia bacterium]|nr:hypothetical protein FACS189444_1300 [Spirochaetia bacterium]